MKTSTELRIVNAFQINTQQRPDIDMKKSVSNKHLRRCLRPQI
jgi:hypothetical protein